MPGMQSTLICTGNPRSSCRKVQQLFSGYSSACAFVPDCIMACFWLQSLQILMRYHKIEFRGTDNKSYTYVESAYEYYSSNYDSMNKI